MTVDPKQLFPIDPFDGQTYIDSLRIKWRYNSEDDNWVEIGYISTLPLARGVNDPEGPTNGLLWATHKRILDITPEKAGGSAFVFKPGVNLSNGVDSILDGDIKIKSSTLDLSCGDGFCADTLKLNIKQEYLDKLCVETRGAQGATGDLGKKGDPGKDGTGDGPQGATGPDGADATTPGTFTGVVIRELSGIHDTAVVDLILDNPTATLEVTKAKIAIPDNDEPATKVSATPTNVEITYTGYNPVQSDTSTSVTTFLDTMGNTTVAPQDWSWFGTNIAPYDTRKRDHSMSFVAASDSAISSVEWALHAITMDVTMVTYISSNNGTLLATSNPYVVTTAFDGTHATNVYKATFTSSVAIEAGQKYWVWSEVTTAGAPLVSWLYNSNASEWIETGGAYDGLWRADDGPWTSWVVTAIPGLRINKVSGSSTNTSEIRLTSYTINDTAIDVIKLPDGWSGSMEGEVAVATMPIATLINALAKYYEAKAEAIIDIWDKEISTYMKAKDVEGRTILSDKANQLSEEVWSAPIEFCLLPSEEVLPACT